MATILTHRETRPPPLPHLTSATTAPKPTIPAPQHFLQHEPSPRHASCPFTTSDQPIDPHDAGASPIIVCSSGASRDPRDFYSTVTATTHRWWPIMKRRSGAGRLGAGVGDQGFRGVSGANGLTPSQMKKFGTGYTKNVVPHVEYDKRVDEGPEFWIENPFETTHTVHFQRPIESTPVVDGTLGVGVDGMVDSAFTRIPPIHKVTDDGSHSKSFNTTTKTDFNARRLHHKNPKFDKSKISASSTAYLSNMTNITGFGDVPESERFAKPAPPVPKSWKSYNATHMDDDGYTRSYRPDIFGVADLKAEEVVTDEAVLEKIRRKDLGRWAECVDPDSKESTTKLTYRAPHPMARTLKLIHSGVPIGIKEAQGSVRNNNNELQLRESYDRGRFHTETGDKYITPTQPTPNVTACDYMTRSGFTRGNKHEFTFDVPSSDEQLARLHPTAACAQQIKDKGVYTDKPSQVKVRRSVSGGLDIGVGSGCCGSRATACACA
ncbi:hypothetical protein HDV00_008819 [Rhizophlyctis rosea]|nr:hypothetical protein HDV00_008819 [Rhizophlyctis rosea]